MKKLRDIGPYLVDERLIGSYTDKTEGIVMDSVNDRDKLKPRIKVMRTENINLLAGSSTVAVFRIKRDDETDAVKSVLQELSQRLKGDHTAGH